MKYSICIEMLFTEYEFCERIKKTKEYGFDYFEFWEWENKNLQDIKKAAVESKIKVASFSGDAKFSMVDRKENTEYIDFIQKSISKAKYLGSNHLVIHSNALMEDGSARKLWRNISREAMLMNIFDVLKRLKTLAEREKICLVLEPLNTIVDHKNYFLDTPEIAFELITAVDSEYIKLLYDIYHMQIMSGNIIDKITKNINCIGYIHAADVPGRHEPGTGELSFSNIFKAIDECDYKGIIGFELSPLYNSEKAMSQLAKVIV